MPLASVELLAPVLRPGKVFAIGLNYADHIAESNMATPEHQVWFTKAVTSINGPYAPILIGRTGPFVDYEIELVAIIGKSWQAHSAANARTSTSSGIASAMMSLNASGSTARRNGAWASPSIRMRPSDHGSPRQTKFPTRTRWPALLCQWREAPGIEHEAPGLRCVGADRAPVAGHDAGAGRCHLSPAHPRGSAPPWIPGSS